MASQVGRSLAPPVGEDDDWPAESGCEAEFEHHVWITVGDICDYHVRIGDCIRDKQVGGTSGEVDRLRVDGLYREGAKRILQKIRQETAAATY